MDIKAFLQCKKLRRSHRLEAKEKSETQTEKMKLGSLGHFSVLPLELKFFILRYLTGNVTNLQYSMNSNASCLSFLFIKKLIGVQIFALFQSPISVEDLSILTITSKAMRNLIEGYRVLMPLIPSDLMQRLHVPKNSQAFPHDKQKVFLDTFYRLGNRLIFSFKRIDFFNYLVFNVI